ncbi:DNA ligase D, ligase domain [compost metagenome]
MKDLSAPYSRRRSKAWLKIKAEETADLRVIGAYHGEVGKQFEKSLGGLIVDFNGVYVDIGGGYSVNRDGKSRDEFYEAVVRDLKKLGLVWHQGERFILSKPRLDALTSMSAEVLGRLIEVEFHEVTEDGSLRHPRYVRFRDDKPVKAEVEAEAVNEEAEFA